MIRALIRPGIRYAWNGTALLVVTPSGECSDEFGLTGFYYREARALRTCLLRIDGKPPWLCEAADISSHTLQFTYAFPEIAEYGGGGSGQSGDEEPIDERGLPQRGLDITVTFHVRSAQLEVSTAIVNRARRTVEFTANWILGADFADIQEAQSGKRQQEAAVRREVSGSHLEFAYEHERLRYVTRVHAAQGELRADGLSLPVRLDPGDEARLDFFVQASDAEGVVGDADVAAKETCVEEWRHRFTRVECPRAAAPALILESNIEDIASFPLLDGRPDEWLALQAGMPLYPAFFGRDAVTAGWQMAMLDRGDTLESAMTRLGRMQSNRVDDWRDEEPGRIPYQVRTGPLAILQANPYSAYYADYASPLMYVVSLANLYAWTGEDGLLVRHWDTAQRILDWAREYGDHDRDGYLEYQTRSPAGTKNQGWKDSGDAIVYDDGRPVPSPIATCELQGYWYAAQLLMGLLCWMRGRHGDARAFWQAAADLKDRFNRDWWMDEEGFVALAMDPEKRLVRAVTSNVGHCLATGIISRDRIPPVVGRLFAPDMFSGWGIRTLSSEHAFYSPLSYHRGTVWAVEQATILFGLRRFGFTARVDDLARALFDLASLYPAYRIPEAVGGFARSDRPTPGAYPQANAPQLWNATAFPLAVQTLAGVLPLAPYRVLLVDPALPEWLPELILRDLRVGAARLSLRFWRRPDGRSEFEVLRKEGTLRILRQPPPESLSAGIFDRLTALKDTVFAS
jgi:glycogen debranching enzyme